MNFEETVNAYQKIVFNVSLSIVNDYFEAENIVQDTFFTYYSKYYNKTDDNVKALLLKIATNKSLDFVKSCAHKNLIPTENEKLSEIKTSDSPEEEYINKEIIETLKSSINTLKEPYRDIAFCYYIKEMTVDEINIRYKINKKSLQTKLYRARDMLKERLKGEIS